MVCWSSITFRHHTQVLLHLDVWFETLKTEYELREAATLEIFFSFLLFQVKRFSNCVLKLWWPRLSHPRMSLHCWEYGWCHHWSMVWVYVVIKDVEQQEDMVLLGEINIHLCWALKVKSGQMGFHSEDLTIAGQQIGKLWDTELCHSHHHSCFQLPCTRKRDSDDQRY